MLCPEGTKALLTSTKIWVSLGLSYILAHSIHSFSFGWVFYIHPKKAKQFKRPAPEKKFFFDGDEQTLQQTYLPREVQVAFKVLMTHWILQFAWRIAFRCVLHRCGSQDIRCWKCWYVSFYKQATRLGDKSNSLVSCKFKINLGLLFRIVIFEVTLWDKKKK